MRISFPSNNITYRQLPGKGVQTRFHFRGEPQVAGFLWNRISGEAKASFCRSFFLRPKAQDLKKS